MAQPSIRSQVVSRRTYSRPKDARGAEFETWEEVIDRVIGHQRWLWERAKGAALNQTETEELSELRTLMIERKSLLAGRTLWLGGTDVAKRREGSNFNCSFSRLATVHDAVDHFWLLLQGCFPAGTQVKLADGSFKSIELIEAGDMVMSFDTDAQEFVGRSVKRTIPNEAKPMVNIRLENGNSITCTEDHPFLTKCGRWVKAKDLAGMEVVICE